DAQFSIAHGLSVGAHRIPVGKRWQDPDVVFDKSVLALMDKISYEPHPDYVQTLAQNPAARLSRIEVVARGTSFTGERPVPKGSPSDDPATYMTTEELVAKFRRNAEGVLSGPDTDAVVDAVLDAESVDTVSTIMDHLRTEVEAVV
ncbi:MAG: MmgE/PrpD family protein, partial [Stackebrandtia sp.]